MHRTKKILVYPILMLSLLVFGLVAQANAADRVDTISKLSFDATIQALTKAIKARGMMIVATVDHQNMLSMVGMNIKGSKTLEFGKPEMGKMVFGMAPEAGLEMPEKIYVFERGDGRTVMSYYTSNYVQYNPEFSKVDEMMAMMLSEIVNEVNK